jgi:hypothetical protein
MYAPVGQYLSKLTALTGSGSTLAFISRFAECTAKARLVAPHVVMAYRPYWSACASGGPKVSNLSWLQMCNNTDTARRYGMFCGNQPYQREFPGPMSWLGTLSRAFAGARMHTFLPLVLLALLQHRHQHLQGTVGCTDQRGEMHWQEVLTWSCACGDECLHKPLGCRTILLL